MGIFEQQKVIIAIVFILAFLPLYAFTIGAKREDTVEFFKFFEKVVFSDIEQKCVANGMIQVENQIDKEILVSSASTILRKHTTAVEQDIVAKQNVEITCGGDDVVVPIDLLEYSKHKRTFLGGIKQGTGCISSGCCPDVHQTTKIKLAIVNKTAIDETVEMVNKIVSEAEASLNVKVNGCGQSVPVKQKINLYEAITDETYKKVRELIKKEVDFKYDGSQTVNIHFRSPLTCVNHCNEQPRSSKITQAMNIEALARNIVDVVAETIDKKIIETSTDTELDYEVSVDDPRSLGKMVGYIYSFWSIFCLIMSYVCCYSLCWLILIVITKGKVLQGNMPGFFWHLMTIFGLFFLLRFWKYFNCVYSKGITGLFTCLGILKSIKCFLLRVFVDPIVKAVSVGFAKKPSCKQGCCSKEEERGESSRGQACTFTR
jgi:hypothetical protein